MGLSDKLKDLGDKAKDAAAEHKDQISQAVGSAGAIANRRTRGKYSDKIAKATSKTEAYVERLGPNETDPPAPAGAEPTVAPKPGSTPTE